MEMDAEQPRLGHYRLERELGRGFSSVVYEAADERRQRTVALKVLTFLPALSEDRRVDLAERFRREAQAVSALSHPSIVAIYEVGHADDGRQYIAMECLPGETLRQRLRRSSPLSVREAVAIAVPVADALHYAHGRGVIHRDVKPDNIFLAQSAGLEATPKLMDFGIAHVLSDEGLTQDGTIVGSPAYMSPEQINGLALDARTDIFSLAVTLTEMVTGAKPFEGETIPAVMQKILHHTPDLRAVADRHLSRVLSKALSKNPNARYPDAAAFADALRQAVPLAAAAPSVATQIMAKGPQSSAAAFQTRRFPRWGAAGLGVLALAALAAWPLATARPTTAYSAPPRLAPTPDGAGVRRREIAAAWPPALSHLDHRPQSHLSQSQRLQSATLVRIAEVTPRRHSLSYYAHPARIASVIQPPKSPPAPRPAASPRPAVIHLASAELVRPIVRVAGVRQELKPDKKTLLDMAPKALPVPKEEMLPSPPAQSVADSSPHLVHGPLPSALAATDSPNATVRLRLSVDENGDVTEATILASSGSRELDDAALDAVGDWQYDPAIKDGQTIPGVVIETMKFSRRR